jgi:glycerol-3-phosphate acyltransferase PlsY
MRVDQLVGGGYLMLQQISMDAMLVAVAYSCTDGVLQMVLLVYALVSAVVYVIVTFVGGIAPVKSLITFSMMVRVSTPILLIFFILNGWRYYMLRDPMDLALLGTWMLLLLTRQRIGLRRTGYHPQAVGQRRWILVLPE